MTDSVISEESRDSDGTHPFDPGNEPITDIIMADVYSSYQDTSPDGVSLTDKLEAAILPPQKPVWPRRMSKSLVNLNPHESDTSRLRQSDESHRESGRKYNPRLEHSISMCDAFNVNWDSEVDVRKEKRPEKKTPWALLTQKSLDETRLWCINNHRVLIRIMDGFTVIVQRLGFISWLRCVRVNGIVNSCVGYTVRRDLESPVGMR